MNAMGLGLGERASLGTKVLSYIRDPLVPTWRKLIGMLAAVYVISPVDLIPDVLPVLGWLDDLGVLAAVAWFFVKEIRKHSATVDATPQPIDPREG